MSGISRELILQAVARGWCAEKNAHKEMDSDLAFAIGDEVLRALSAEQPAKEAVAFAWCREVSSNGSYTEMETVYTEPFDPSGQWKTLYTLPSAAPRPSERRVGQQPHWYIATVHGDRGLSTADRRKPTERKDSDE